MYRRALIISIRFLNADKHSPASSARSDCVHEQVAKLDPVSRAAGMDCEYSFYQEGLYENHRNQLCPGLYPDV